MNSLSREIDDEYQRIQKRATDDPGTAGDQGEENWATILRDWLSPQYQVVTKGRILGFDGTASPQVDVIVLRPAYPRKLLDKKLYLAGGVVAAFECKVTLKAQHIEQAVKNAAQIHRLVPERIGTPRLELFSSIIYGLLAHSHAWTSTRSCPMENIERRLMDADAKHTYHPREMLDLICIADLAVWNTSKTPRPPILDPATLEKGVARIVGYGPPRTNYNRHVYYETVDRRPRGAYTPIGALIHNLMYKLAYEDKSLRPLAYYFVKSPLITGFGGGTKNVRVWPETVLSPEVLARYPTESTIGGKSASPNREGNFLWHDWPFCFT